jgi:hypothetical protein
VQGNPAEKKRSERMRHLKKTTRREEKERKNETFKKNQMDNSGDYVLLANDTRLVSGSRTTPDTELPGTYNGF